MLRRIKGIDLSVLVGGSRGVTVLKSEHSRMHGMQIDEQWEHVQSGDVRDCGQQVQRRSWIATVGADVDETLIGREKGSKLTRKKDW